MKLLEIITLRSSEQEMESLERELLICVAEVGQKDCGVVVELYRHAKVGTDLSMHLHYESGRGHPFGSDLGLRLAAALEQFGQVHHSVWVLVLEPADPSGKIH